MNFNEFKRLIKEKIIKYLDQNEGNYLSDFKKLLVAIEQIPKNKDLIMLTQLTILFEGFYLSYKNTLLFDFLFDLRVTRWRNHDSLPTVSFLITYKEEIHRSTLFFSNVNQSHAANEEKVSIGHPWLIDYSVIKKLIFDEQNNIVYDADRLNKAFDAIAVPTEKEKPGVFVKTHNASGGFTTAPDEFSSEFIKEAKQVYINGGRILDIGTGFGAASIRLFDKKPGKGLVYVNDIHPGNLAVVFKRVAAIRGVSIEATPLATGDDIDLRCLPAEFPRELTRIPIQSIDIILICRVLHFFKGDTIDASLQLLAKKLKPGGRIFIVCETPHLGNWKKFAPVYEENRKRGLKWPGEVNETTKYEAAGRSAALPPFMHFIDKDVLEAALKRNGFDIIKIGYINREGQFPPDLLLDGRESVGACAATPEHMHIKARL